MEQGYRRILWGLFITAFHINISSIPILPAFVGWIAVYQGTYDLSTQNKINGFVKARNYAFVLIIITLASQLLSWMGVNNDMLPFLGVVVLSFELIYIYSVYEGSIEYLDMIGDRLNVEHYIRVQRAFVILLVIDALMACAALTLADQLLNVCTAVFGIILIISFMISLRTLKNMKPPSVDKEQI